MVKGSFQEVLISDELKIKRGVKGFHFVLRKLEEDPSKIVMEVLLESGKREVLKVEFKELVPEWIFQRTKADVTIYDLIEFGANHDNMVDLIDWALDLSVQELEEQLVLMIGLDCNEEEYEIYFSVRYKPQKVSIWDRTLSSETLKDFITIVEEDYCN